jgi:hypothetical protein
MYTRTAVQLYSCTSSTTGSHAAMQNLESGIKSALSQPYSCTEGESGKLITLSSETPVQYCSMPGMAYNVLVVVGANGRCICGWARRGAAPPPLQTSKVGKPKLQTSADFRGLERRARTRRPRWRKTTPPRVHGSPAWRAASPVPRAAFVAANRQAMLTHQLRVAVGVVVSMTLLLAAGIADAGKPDDNPCVTCKCCCRCCTTAASLIMGFHCPQ